MSLATSPAMAVGVRVLGHEGTEEKQKLYKFHY